MVKILTVNVLLLLALVIIIDVPITLSFYEKNAVDGVKNGKITCSSELTGYDYCPSITHYDYMDKRDGILPIINYIDKDKQSTYKNSYEAPIVTRSKTIYLIGDSFIQARQIKIEDRFDHELRKLGYKVEVHGYSSWNSWQFERIINQLNIKKGDIVFVFSMGNDFTVSYDRSTVPTINRYKKSPPFDEIYQPERRGVFSDYINQSFFLNRGLPSFPGLLNIVKTKILQFNPFKEKQNTSYSSFDLFNQEGLTCKKIWRNKNNVTSDLMFDYLLLSQKSDCWYKDLMDSVNVNIMLLKSIQLRLEAKGATSEILLIPGGWAFNNQNSIGRSLKPTYDFPLGTKTSQASLVQYISDNGVKITDSTTILEEANIGKDSLYFPVDGHWTKYAHKVIFDYLLKQHNLLSIP